LRRKVHALVYIISLCGVFVAGLLALGNHSEGPVLFGLSAILLMSWSAASSG
jgi:hypothetical protein